MAVRVALSLFFPSDTSSESYTDLQDFSFSVVTGALQGWGPWHPLHSCPFILHVGTHPTWCTRLMWHTSYVTHILRDTHLTWHASYVMYVDEENCWSGTWLLKYEGIARISSCSLRGDTTPTGCDVTESTQALGAGAVCLPQASVLLNSNSQLYCHKEINMAGFGGDENLGKC